MFGKKGIDGMYYAVCLLIGLIGGIIVAIALMNRGILTAGMIPI